MVPSLLIESSHASKLYEWLDDVAGNLANNTHFTVGVDTALNIARRLPGVVPSCILQSNSLSNVLEFGIFEPTSMQRAIWCYFRTNQMIAFPARCESKPKRLTTKNERNNQCRSLREDQLGYLPDGVGYQPLGWQS
jgi:hypothetical protein